ncbi:unnamed protein product [Prunus armeniaca]|uniref:Uncharacterized protein n=1 Tax=Prunus armeniaca TaxID=36596 RepID=A0A6J5WTT8_PRUAR|nr:unnamed protein product [Prunus armeniaca]
MDASKRLQPNLGDGNEDVEDRNIPRGLSNGTTETKEAKKARCLRRQFGVVALVWVAIVALQIAMKPVDGNYFTGTETCDKMFSGILVIDVSQQRNSWRFAEFRWRIHYGSTVSGDWDPSSALYFAAADILFAVIGQILEERYVPLGRVGIANMVKQIEHKEYIGLRESAAKDPKSLAQII